MSSSGAFIRGYIYLGYLYPSCVYLGMACKGWEWHWGSQLCLQPHSTLNTPGISATCPSPALLRAPRSPRAAGILLGPFLCHSLVLSLSCHSSCGAGQLSSPTHRAGEQFGAGMWGHGDSTAPAALEFAAEPVRGRTAVPGGYGYSAPAAPFLANQNQKHPASISGRRSLSCPKTLGLGAAVRGQLAQQRRCPFCSQQCPFGAVALHGATGCSWDGLTQPRKCLSPRTHCILGHCFGMHGPRASVEQQAPRSQSSSHFGCRHCRARAARPFPTVLQELRWPWGGC